MRENKSILKTGLLTGILVLLFIPLLQSTFNIKGYIRPLKGAYVDKKDTSLTIENWLSGSYQSKKDEFLSYNFGFRNYYVMLNNQLAYWLFKKANVWRVVVGKGDFLYESHYIESYYGDNFIGKKAIEDRLNKLKDLQDLLYMKGIYLDLILAPGKASFYPEYIPDNYKSVKKLNNYEYTAEYCKKSKINFMDFNDWFLKLKPITPYDLFPKTGIHWSNYGSILAIDSITRYLEHQSKLNLKNFIIENIELDETLRSPDDDIGEAMNLAFKIPVLPMPYASYYWPIDSTVTTPPALLIGDSYRWNIYAQGFTNNIFSKCNFWYYNKTIFPETEPIRSTDKINLLEEVLKQKFILLMVTECNVQDLGWNFIENLHSLLKEDMTDIFRKKVYINAIIEEIKKTPQWMADIKIKAREKSISIDEMILLDAEYIYKTDYGREEVVRLTNDTKQRILNTPEWVEQIKIKAKENNVSFEEMLELDAKYIYVTEQRGKN